MSETTGPHIERAEGAVIGTVWRPVCCPQVPGYGDSAALLIASGIGCTPWSAATALSRHLAADHGLTIAADRFLEPPHPA